MAIECTDSRVCFWQVNTGHLDRVEGNPGVVDDLLQDFDWGVGVGDSNSGIAVQKTLSVARQGKTFWIYAVDGNCFVILVNLKRLISEVSEGGSSHLRRPSALDKNDLDPLVASGGASGSSISSSENSKIDSLALCGILSALITWTDLNESMTEAFREKANLFPCGTHVSVGMLGMNGFLSIPFPDKDGVGNEWNISSNATASRLVQILSLSKTLFEQKGI